MVESCRICEEHAAVRSFYERILGQPDTQLGLPPLGGGSLHSWLIAQPQQSLITGCVTTGCYASRDQLALRRVARRRYGSDEEEQPGSTGVPNRIQVTVDHYSPAVIFSTVECLSSFRLVVLKKSWVTIPLANPKT